MANNEPNDDLTFEAVCEKASDGSLISRRNFLLGSSATVALLSIPAWLRGPRLGPRAYAQVATFERRHVGSLTALRVGEPVTFNYPWEHPQSVNELIKLEHRAGGGVGPNQDIVAFNTFCTHQGGPLAGTFKADVGVAGPCPLHWTTFDLTRHGMVVGGHATLGLPQIILETEGDDIIATGVLGLIFGYHDNSVDPTTLEG